MKRTIVGAQGEVKIYKINRLPDLESPRGVDSDARGRHIISHSETGHHHVIDGSATVLERTNDVPPGMRIIYAIVKDPTVLEQTAPTPHEGISLDEGLYEFRISREYDPFADQARRVAD